MIEKAYAVELQKLAVWSKRYTKHTNKPFARAIYWMLPTEDHTGL